MEFKAGDRVHVTRYCEEKVDFYTTLSFIGLYNFEMKNCSDIEYEGKLIAMPKTEFFGIDNEDYYTLATDEEDTEEPEVQHVNDKFSFARSKNYDVQEYIQEGINLNIAKNMKEGCTMPTIKTKKEMNERELIKYLVDHESTNIYSSGISIDGAWISIKRQKHGSVELVDIDIRINTIRSYSHCVSDKCSRHKILGGI